MSSRTFKLESVVILFMSDLIHFGAVYESRYLYRHKCINGEAPQHIAVVDAT